MRHPAALSNAISRRWRPYRFRAYLIGAAAGLLVGGVAAPIVTSLAALALSLTPLPLLAVGWDEIVWIGAFVLAFAWTGAWTTARWLPRDDRAAIEAYLWLAIRAEDHWRRVLGVPVPRTTEAQRAFLDATPVTPETAGELASIWLALGDLDTARQVVALMPHSTAMDRYDRAGAEWLIDFMAGTADDVSALEGSLAELAAGEGGMLPDELLERQVNVAVDASRVALAAGRDWIEPLARVRPLLGEEPSRIMWSFAAVPAFKRLLGFGVVGAIAFGISLLR